MPKPPPVMTTKAINLRPWTKSDAGLISQHLNTKNVMKFLGGVATSSENTKLLRWLKEDQQEWHGITFWCLERRDDQEFLGFGGLVRVDEVDSTVLDCIELGYRLREEAWNKGYAKEASVASLYYAFEELRAHRVVSRTTVHNWQSWGLMKRLGFRHDPRLDYESTDGEALIVHVMTREMWDKCKKELPDPRV